MKSIVNSLCLSLLAVIGLVRCEENFGNTAFCGGSKQSPIDVRRRDLTTREYDDLQWSIEYGKKPLKMTITGGGSLVVGTEYLKGAVPLIWGGPLQATYKLIQFHFHWAQNKDGSEHLVNGNRYFMEMHAVHIKENLTYEQAGQDKNGFAVLGYFFQNSAKRSHGLTHIIEAFANIHSANRTAPVTIPRPFPINDLIRPVSCNYVTYKGSLTTPPCTENVRWIISPYLNTISTQQMEQFRSLSKDDRVNKDNYRNLQKRNYRKIFYAVRYGDSHKEYDYPSYEYQAVKKDESYNDHGNTQYESYSDDKTYN